VAASLVHAVGLPQLVAADDGDVYRRTLDLARDAGAREAMRQHLLAARRASPLFDNAGFTRDLERIYREIARRTVRGDRGGLVLAAAG
jgi:predicted O-linked N-acetylglucosamine transferase (SPINDLY family)